MKAAVVRSFGKPPVYEDFEEPVARPGETIVSVAAAAASHLAVARASAAHYSAGASLPFVAGFDGVGRTPDGPGVFFALPRPPFGSMAERAPVPTNLVVPLPEGMDPVTAAAAANPGMSCWVPLTTRARIPPGESVLVNGATGSAGRMAVQVAKYLGARKVIATGRDEAKLAGLSKLGADVVLSLRQPASELRDAIRAEARSSRVGVVLDYLWGPSAETIIDALGGPMAPRGSSRVAFVQVGTVTGPTITLDGAKLRSSGLELLGTGLGSSTVEEVMAGIREFLKAFVAGQFQMEFVAHPLRDIERMWAETSGDKRIVFTVP